MIPTIEQALIYLGLKLEDVHHYHGRDGALTVVANDARKFRVSQADIETGIVTDSSSSPPALMPDLPTIAPGAENVLTTLRARAGQRKRIKPRE